MSDHCERCRKLEGQIFELWTALFPRVTWIDAESALRFMRVEYESLTEGNRARLDALEAHVNETERRMSTRELGVLSKLFGPAFPMVLALLERAPETANKAEAKIRERLRRPWEIQRAHDGMYIALSNPEVKSVVFEGDVSSFQYGIAHLDVLCWVLGHTHNDTFLKNLTRVDMALVACGYELVDSGDLHEPGEGPRDDA